MEYFVTNSTTQDNYGMSTLPLQTVMERLIGKTALGVDTETSGLNFLDDNLLMLQVFDGTDNYVIDCQTVNVSPLSSIFADKNVLKIFHNAKFDIKFLRANGLTTENVYDTMLAERILHGGKSSIRIGLKFLFERYFKIQIEKETRSTFINHHGDFSKAQLVYGLNDTEKLIEIMTMQQSAVDKLDLQHTIWLEMNAVQVFADIEFEGIYLDKEAWSVNSDKNKLQMDTLGKELDALLLEKHPEYDSQQVDMFGEGRRATINWGSPLQVLKLLRKYDKKLDSAGGPALKDLSKSNSLVHKYVTFKEVSKAYNSYGPDFYKYLYSDGKVHTNFKQLLDTGRVSSSKPNLQQIPADNAYRNAFVPKNKDWVFVSSDFSAQELCIIAFGSKDPVWLEVLRTGGDLHGTCAELIFGERWTKLGGNNAARKDTIEGKKLRTHVKTLNFGLAYGMGAFSLSKQLEITEDEATALIEKYFDTFPKIKGFLDSCGKYGAQNGHIRTYKPFRRIRFFESWKGSNTDKMELSKIIRASKNTPIQGTGADMTKLALVLLRRRIKHLSWVKIVLTVHDEINCICHKDRAEEFSKILTSTMERAAVKIVGEGLLKCDATITPRWEK